MFRKQNVSDALLDKLVIYVVIATIVGARLGHVLFYGPYFDTVTADGIILERGYFSHPGDILKVWEGGLASHGGIFAIWIALILYSKYVVKMSSYWILDKMVAPGAIGGCFIRLGNLMNSEIVGNYTDVPWGFKFAYLDAPVDMNGNLIQPIDWASIPARHPAQLYEAIAYLVIFLVLVFLYWKKEAWRFSGRLFGIFLIFLFSARFLIEFVKVGQTDRDDVWAINTGQMLSIPFILVGVFILWRSFKAVREERDTYDLA